MLPEAMSWTEIQSGNMDPDPVLLVAEILAICTVAWVCVYWERLCHDIDRRERDGPWAAQSALSEIDDICRRWPEHARAGRLAGAVRGVIGKHRRAGGTRSGGR